MRNLKLFLALLFLGIFPMVSGWSSTDEKIYFNRELLEITEDEIILYLVDEKIYLDAVHSDDNGLFIYADQVYKDGFWYCAFCSESHPDGWLSCPFSDVQQNPTTQDSIDIFDPFED